MCEHWVAGEIASLTSTYNIVGTNERTFGISIIKMFSPDNTSTSTWKISQSDEETIITLGNNFIIWDDLATRWLRTFTADIAYFADDYNNDVYIINSKNEIVILFILPPGYANVVASPHRLANAVPANAVPANAVPANAVPANAVPANAVPANAVPQFKLRGDSLRHPEIFEYMGDDYQTYWITDDVFWVDRNEQFWIFIMLPTQSFIGFEIKGRDSYAYCVLNDDDVPPYVLGSPILRDVFDTNLSNLFHALERTQ